MFINECCYCHLYTKMHGVTDFGILELDKVYYRLLQITDSCLNSGRAELLSSVQ